MKQTKHLLNQNIKKTSFRGGGTKKGEKIDTPKNDPTNIGILLIE